MTTPPAASYEHCLLQAQSLRNAGTRGRYAPSPTGRLHLGNLRTALLAWLQSRLAGGAFVLRMEDLDQPRTRPGSAEQILDDLRWLGLDWDEGPDCGGPAGPYTQSARFALYEEALRHLQAQGRVFPCFCSRKDLAQAASAPHIDEGGGLYPGTCRELSPREQQTRQQRRPDRAPAWRFRAPPMHIDFDDALAGKRSHNLQQETGDFVLRRADALFAYQLAVVVDDALMGITDVLRGADLLSSTPRQIALFSELGIPWRPTYWHVPLLRDAAGKRLSKRDGADTLAAAREGGEKPARVVGYLAASVNLVPAGSELSARELLQETTLGHFQSQLARAFETDDGQADTMGNPL